MKSKKSKTYLSTQDHFIKQVKNGSKKTKQALEREYHNLEYLYEKGLKSNIDVPKSISFNAQEILLKTELIDGKNLKKYLNPVLFNQFGEELKKLHVEDEVTHGELEVQDVIKKENTFFLVDLASLNEKHRLRDYARFKVSLFILQVKQPWNWFRIKKCIHAFTQGYNPDPKLSKPRLVYEITWMIKQLKEKGFINRIKSFMLFLLVKPRIYLAKR